MIVASENGKEKRLQKMWKMPLRKRLKTVLVIMPLLEIIQN